MREFLIAGIISLLPFIMVAATTLGYWSNNAQKIRLSQFIGSPCVLLYDVLIRSWGVLTPNYKDDRASGDKKQELCGDISA